MPSLNERIAEELAIVRTQCGGVLPPTAVVDWAKAHPDSALHGQFDWNDDEAAHKWRLEQARRVIRMEITVIRDDLPAVRANFSLIDDRKAGSGYPGYRRIEDVLADDDLRERMLATAIVELQALRTKYALLKELAGVFGEVEKLTTRSVPRHEELRASA